MAHDKTPPPEDATRLDDGGETRLSAGSGSKSGGAVTSSTGWLSSSDAIDHGRFPPGTLLGGRYRIVGRLGRGGMGEVYRADDLKLAQPVALKFLPADVDHDPARLMQLHNEVRMARQVSHPNVCRVYDIDEVDGHTFLSMEFVDGEELGSLLRRFGRFSSERSLELARQICAGLAAAHERGVVHRDLKPANVMLDGTGKVRITDFGLAGAAGESIRAGTPAYMAPEQLAGAEVTAQSDIYALGLVLYELFTGQRAIEAKNVADLVRKREAGIVPPSQVVRDLDPAIDRAIMRCLERDPADRPFSALGVAAALPGGDPLAAALAAGETPSPEMVAASGGAGALAPLRAITGLVATLLLLVLVAAMSDRVLITSYVPLDRPPEVLTDRAREIVRALGYTDPPVDTAWGFGAASDYLRFARERGDGAATRARLRTGRPEGMRFWYRSSPRELVPEGLSERVTPSNPPFVLTGMQLVTVDTDGRLVELQVVPPQMESSDSPAVDADWKRLFELAGLDFAQYQSVPSVWTPREFADRRAAWEGPMPGWPDQRLRVEAASYRGRVVFFKEVGPWTQPDLMRAEAPSRAQTWTQTFISLCVVLVLGGAVLVARNNLRKGRGDRRGASRIAGATFVAAMLTWIAGTTHATMANQEMQRFFVAIGGALFGAGSLWVLYLALEPYVRRLWPSTLVSWSRLVAGSYRDPRIGRDLMAGILCGLLIALTNRSDSEVRALFGLPVVPPIVPNLSWLEGTRMLVANISDLLFSALFNGLWLTFGIVVINLMTRRPWVTGIVMTLFILMTSAGNIANSPAPWITAGTELVIIIAIVLVMMRLGLLATVVLFLVNFLFSSAVLTLDASKWFFPSSAALLALFASIGVYGFYASRGGEPLFGRRILD